MGQLAMGSQSPGTVRRASPRETGGVNGLSMQGWDGGAAKGYKDQEGYTRHLHSGLGAV